jgi:hypothetical protein
VTPPLFSRNPQAFEAFGDSKLEDKVKKYLPFICVLASIEMVLFR